MVAKTLGNSLRRVLWLHSAAVTHYIEACYTSLIILRVREYFMQIILNVSKIYVQEHY